MFSDVINQLLKQRNIRRSVLAKECGIPYTTIISWLDRKCDKVSFSYLVKLSEYFNVTIEYLIKGVQSEQMITPLSEFEEKFISFYRSSSKEDQEIIERFTKYIIRT